MADAAAAGGAYGEEVLAQEGIAACAAEKLAFLPAFPRKFRYTPPMNSAITSRKISTPRYCFQPDRSAIYARADSSALMRKPVLPLSQEEKDWVAAGIKASGLDKVDMTQFEK